jgi:cobaltochelatase CobN
MHLLSTSSTSLDDIVEPVDLGQTPGDIAILSFADSDLAGLSAAWAAERDVLPSVRLVQLRDLKHPMSVDLWIERVASHARVIVVRLLGGLDWWRYGADRLSSLAKERGIALAMLPGEDRDDPRLAESSTLPPDELSALLGYFREGGRDNLRALLRRLSRHAGASLPYDEPQPLPRSGGYLAGAAVDLDELIATMPWSGPVVPIVFYRSMLLASDVAPIDELCAAIANQGYTPAPLFVPSLKDPDASAFLREAMRCLRPSVIVTTTAFAAGDGANGSPLDDAGVPVLQAVVATTRRAAWLDSSRGLGAVDLAMHVVLPELDGRVLAGAMSFKDPSLPLDGLSFTGMTNRPEPDRIRMIADRVVAWSLLQTIPREHRRIAVLMPDYPGAAGRTGYAVGLDVPASVLALLNDLDRAGFRVRGVPQSSQELLSALESRVPGMDRVSYSYAFARPLVRAGSHEVVSRVKQAVTDAWGPIRTVAKTDPDFSRRAFRFRGKKFGNVTVVVPPDRGRTTERRANYHDPSLPPRHALMAFGFWLQEKFDVVIHMGAHGTLEWLPGKAVALTASCFPEAVLGALPVIYPFIVSNPGEAAQAKRRIAAVTIGHLPPPLVGSELSGDARKLEQLVDEYAQADGLDRRRRERLAQLIAETAKQTGLARDAGVDPDASPDEALRRIDAWLCDLKDLAVKDGQHIYGRVPDDADASRRKSAERERASLLDALDGRRVPPGPAGSPHRERRDVLPTGRNMYTADPRMLPTPTAMELGRMGADEVLRGYMQAHGEMPRSLVIDLWGSATLRTGGEEIAQGLALMGCRPAWDVATGRVTGVEVMPCAVLGRARVDVTWRISGLFRDLFPAQIALLDAAVKAVAARDEADGENPLAAVRRSANGQSGEALARIFGTAPGAYGAGIDDLVGSDAGRDDIGASYLAAASHAYGGADGESSSMPGAFAGRVAEADLLIHTGDDPASDLLEGADDAAFVGGFAAAAASFGRNPDLIMLDTTDPQRPRARTLAAALARIVRARAINPRFIAGQMRHGPRGAAEFAETVDRLVDFARTTDAVPSALLDLVHEAYLMNPAVRAFLARENPAAAQAMTERFEQARRLGLWHPRRNDIGVEAVE